MRICLGNIGLESKVTELTDKEIIESIQSVWELESRAVANLAGRVDKEVMVTLVKTFASLGPNRLFTTGSGTSAAAARKIAHTLSCVGIPTSFIVPSDAVHGGLGVLQEDDTVIMLSKGGGTPDVVQMIPSIKKRKAKIIGVTENKDSIVAQSSDILVEIKVDREACPFNMLATASTIAVIATFDAVASTLITYAGYTKEDFAVIHPSGAVGDRLLRKREEKGMI